MKHFFYIALIITFSALMNSCGDKKTAAVAEQSSLPVFEFGRQDSLDIRALAEDYMSRFNAGNFESAADLLFTVSNDSIHPLTDEQRMGYITAMQALPQFGCVLRELALYSDRDNELRLAIKMDPNADADHDKGTINFFLNPIQVDGKWYLTLLSEYAEGVGLYH
jgi:hypothetical protein